MIMELKKIMKIGVSATACLAICSQVNAAAIGVVNPGFEYTTNGDGSGGNNTVAGVVSPTTTYFTDISDGGLPNFKIADDAAGWSENGTVEFLGWTTDGISAGAQSLDASYFSANAPTGAGTFSNTDGELTQALSGELMANMIYTLSIEVYDRYGSLDTANVMLQLRDGSGTDLGGTLSIDPLVDGVATATVMLTTGISVASSDLQIAIGSLSGQINFDNVSLDAVAVPEPGSMMALIGLAGAVIVRRRK